ncbi:permease for cytosine/purine, uracil, thiamine, allantoin family protein [Rickettsia hoogstraalii str. RCCE3]|nr:permease for cytosine/purine, uracil, thiamine, allantoin family protein [Rickettsia hoogstraalii str. RCCE3]
MLDKQCTHKNSDYAISRVPLEARSNLFSVTLIRIGAMTSLAQFMLGALLGYSMTFKQALLATFLGSVILEFVSLGLGVAGAREGLSTSILARWCGFGHFGSAFIGFVIAISMLGWFGVQNSVLANSLDYILNGWLGFKWSAIISGSILTILVTFGFSALHWTAKLAVPLFFLVVGYIIIGVLAEHNVAVLMTSPPTGNQLSLGDGATIVAGGFMAGSLATPDISRYCKNSKHVFWMTIISIIIGELIINAVSILIAHALNTSDVVTIMTPSAGFIGLITVILSTIKINDINLYSSSLALANSIEAISGKYCSYKWLTIILGIIGTALSIIGILEVFSKFLILLGVVFPPITGVMLTDYYILCTSRKLLETTRSTNTLPESVPIGWKALFACIFGVIIGFKINQGIPSVNSLFSSAIFYCVLNLKIVNSFTTKAK